MSSSPRLSSFRCCEYFYFSSAIILLTIFSDPEAEIWYGIPEFDILAKNITVPGLSPLFPDVHCTEDGDVCQVVTGESEINAATTISSLVRSPRFDLTTSYWMVAGIAGVNPEVATICAATFSRYAVQVALQYEFDPREIPANFSTGYIPLGSTVPDEYPQSIVSSSCITRGTIRSNHSESTAQRFSSSTKISRRWPQTSLAKPI